MVRIDLNEILSSNSPPFLKKKQRKKYEKNIKQSKNKSQKRKETKTLL
jgi:hypothetical protein